MNNEELAATVAKVAEELFVNETGHSNWCDYHQNVKDKYIRKAQAALSSINLAKLLAEREQQRAVMAQARDALATCKEEYNEYLDFKGANGMEQVFNEDLVAQALAALNEALGG